MLTDDNSESSDFRSSKSIELAMSFAKIARQDSRASIELYRWSFFPQAIFAFQQAVEKDAKSVGLLMGFLDPTAADLKKVSHDSLLGLLLRMPERLDGLPVLKESIRKELTKPQLKRFHLMRMFEPIMRPPAANSEIARAAIRQLRAVDRRKAWRTTLALDPNEQLTKTVRNMLVVADQKCKEADEAELFLRRMRRVAHERFGISIDQSGSKFFLNVAVRAIQEIVPLTLLTMWHEQEARYPPVSNSDYWDVEEYKGEKGLIRELPNLYQHLDRLVKSTLAGARFARKLVGANLQGKPRRA